MADGLRIKFTIRRRASFARYDIACSCICTCIRVYLRAPVAVSESFSRF